jgi:phosphomannomutase
MTHRFDPTSLREYDIRGIVGKTLGVEDAYAIGRGFATHVRRAGGTRVAVGRDGRVSSPPLEEALVRGLTESGVDVVRVGLGPTPMLYYAEAVLEVDGGIQITGSHNPADYNGFKMVLQHGPFFGAEIQSIGKMAEEGDWEEGTGEVSDYDIEDMYVDRLLAGYSGGAFRIGWDNGNGAGGRVLEKLVAKLPGEHHLLYTEIDGTFPNHHPDPTEEKNLADLKKLVAEKNLDFGIAFDGDADRIGAIDGLGRVVWRSVALYPVRAGAESPPRRDDHRRRQGEPGAVRPRRRTGRQPGDVEDGPQPHQGQDEGNEQPARG